MRVNAARGLLAGAPRACRLGPMDERVTRESPFLRHLAALADDPRRERISVSDVFSAGGPHGAVVALVLVFALPNVIPALPGTSAVLGLPLLLLTLEWMLGRAAWLPSFIARRSIARHDFAALLARAALAALLQWLG
jgi:hypothetical protein